MNKHCLKICLTSAALGITVGVVQATETAIRKATGHGPPQDVMHLPTTADLRSNIIPLTLEDSETDASSDAMQAALATPTLDQHTALVPTARELAESDPQILEDERERVQKLMRQARLALRQRSFAEAEQFYQQTLVLHVSTDLHKSLMLEVAYMYEMSGQRAKMAAVYEKFSEMYPHDPRLPQIFLRLGHLYREMGATRTAVARFYNVLNVSLSIPEESIPLYRELSQQAQLEIAETYFMNGDYDQAAKFYGRVMRLDLDDNERERVAFKDAYIHHLRHDHPGVILGLEQFLADYPESHLAPESHYLLATAYRNTNQPEKSMDQVMRLLRHKSVAAASDQRIWMYWQKKAANQMANEYYEKGDFYSALKIYQAMAPLSADPEWQWPVIYQMGLCFERLGMYPKARDAYAMLSTGEGIETEGYQPNESLLALQDMAGWRLNHVQWADHTRRQLNDLKNNEIELLKRPSQIPEEAVVGVPPGSY
ncbi:MAG: tetratricopeptide repeat protein [Opitutales bacterium]